MRGLTIHLVRARSGLSRLASELHDCLLVHTAAESGWATSVGGVQRWYIQIAGKTRNRTAVAAAIRELEAARLIVATWEAHGDQARLVAVALAPEPSDVQDAEEASPSPHAVQSPGHSGDHLGVTSPVTPERSHRSGHTGAVTPERSHRSGHTGAVTPPPLGSPPDPPSYTPLADLVREAAATSAEPAREEPPREEPPPGPRIITEQQQAKLSVLIDKLRLDRRHVLLGRDIYGISRSEASRLITQLEAREAEAEQRQAAAAAPLSPARYEAFVARLEQLGVYEVSALEAAARRGVRDLRALTEAQATSVIRECERIWSDTHGGQTPPRPLRRRHTQATPTTTAPAPTASTQSEPPRPRPLPLRGELPRDLVEAHVRLDCPGLDACQALAALEDWAALSCRCCSAHQGGAVAGEPERAQCPACGAQPVSPGGVCTGCGQAIQATDGGYQYKRLGAREVEVARRRELSTSTGWRRRQPAGEAATTEVGR